MIRAEHLAADDRGTFTLMGVIALIALTLMLGAGYHAAEQMRTVRHAYNVAAEAARAAAQAIDPALAIPGDDKVIDPALAAAAAEAYLDAADAEGTVTVADDGQSVTVTVTIAADGLFSGLVGVTPKTVTGTATATLLTG